MRLLHISRFQARRARYFDTVIGVGITIDLLDRMLVSWPLDPAWTSVVLRESSHREPACNMLRLLLRRLNHVR